MLSLTNPVLCNLPANPKPTKKETESLKNWWGWENSNFISNHPNLKFGNRKVAQGAENIHWRKKWENFFKTGMLTFIWLLKMMKKKKQSDLKM
jgi:hypothetical protein